MTDVKRFQGTITEAANRAEATALLIRCGYRVYRPEADIDGEDLVVRTREGRLFGVQLKSRLHVDDRRYGRKELLLLFPSGPYREEVPRHWYLVPHDDLYEEVKGVHGGAAKWSDRWSEASIGPHLRGFLANHVLRSAPESSQEDESPS